MHLLVDAGGDRLPAAFRRQLIDVGHEEFDLAAEHAARRIDLLDSQLRAVQVIGVVGDAIGRRQR